MLFYYYNVLFANGLKNPMGDIKLQKKIHSLMTTIWSMTNVNPQCSGELLFKKLLFDYLLNLFLVNSQLYIHIWKQYAF